MCRTLITGLKYPIPAAAVCGLWTVGRITFTQGYISGDPQRVSFRDFWLCGGILTTWITLCIEGDDLVSVG